MTCMLQVTSITIALFDKLFIMHIVIWKMLNVAAHFDPFWSLISSCNGILWWYCHAPLFWYLLFIRFTLNISKAICICFVLKFENQLNSSIERRVTEKYPIQFKNHVHIWSLLIIVYGKSRCFCDSFKLPSFNSDC